jgi:hypothetical protein
MESSVHHQGVEFEVVEVSRFRWRWTIYAKKSLGLGKTTREVPGTSRKQVVAKCRYEIDRKLERSRSAQGTSPTAATSAQAAVSPTPGRRLMSLSDEIDSIRSAPKRN